jgi:hypothetical protein
MERRLLIAVFGSAGILEDAKAVKARILHYANRYCNAVQIYPASMQGLEIELLNLGAMFDESQGRRL